MKRNEMLGALQEHFDEACKDGNRLMADIYKMLIESIRAGKSQTDGTVIAHLGFTK